MGIRLTAEARNENTKSELNLMRSSGKIPGVVYSKGHPSSSIAIDQKELLALLQSTPHAIVTMNVPHQGIRSVVINEVQRDKVSHNLLHVDFHQINLNEALETIVRLDINGESKGEKMGGFLHIQLHEVTVKCMPNKIPAHIEVDTSHLELGESLFVRDLKAPEEVEIKSDPNEVVATIMVPKVDKEIEALDEENAKHAAEASDAEAVEAVEE